MTAINSTLYRDGKFVSTQRQHAFNKNLTCKGKYKVDAELKGVKKAREFTLVKGSNSIEIDFDK